ncbi:MAG: HepT-like ribonuclease domain-containing protein [Phycisphaeraceae bacterium]
MPLDRDPATLLDMATAARRVLAFTDGYSAQAFFDDEKTQSAVLHQLLILGEAAKRLSPQMQGRIDGVPWRDMARMRDRLIHHYETV